MDFQHSMADIFPTSEGHLLLPERSLVVFVDDTGHEALVPGQPVYGLGGCAVMSEYLDVLIRGPWREVRRRVTGSTNSPLHASDFGQIARPQDIEAVASFFRQNPFSRFGAVVSVNAHLVAGLGPLQTIAKVLQLRIVEIARWTPFREVHIIFESSQRADPLIENAMQDFGLEESGKSIPVECYFMPKSAGEPGLEVADFVVHAVGRQARANLKQRSGFALDYAAVFQSVDPRLTSLMEVESTAL
jgi:hypothetical protein